MRVTGAEINQHMASQAPMGFRGEQDAPFPGKHPAASVEHPQAPHPPPPDQPVERPPLHGSAVRMGARYKTTLPLYGRYLPATDF